ncbi:hypothetical protein ACXYUI_26545 [Klebsiella pneumoniae]
MSSVLPQTARRIGQKEEQTMKVFLVTPEPFSRQAQAIKTNQ